MASSNRPATPPATLDKSHSYRLRASRTGEAYRIDVAEPFGPAAGSANARLKVVYVLDGNGMFALAAQTARLMQLGEDLPPLLVVGIGYDTQSQSDVLSKRMHDLTSVPGRVRDVPGEVGGGADAFLAFIDDEVKPLVASRYEVDPRDATLVGDSLSGLFAMHVLFTSPGSFARYVAGSPSLWWADGVAFREEAACADRGRELSARVFVSVGALEEDPTNERLRPFAMVSNLERMVATLRDRQHRGLVLDSHVFPFETHTSVIPATISRGLRSVLADRS